MSTLHPIADTLMALADSGVTDPQELRRRRLENFDTHPRLTAIEVSDNDESSYQAPVSIHVTFVDPKADEGEAAPSKLLT